MDVKKKVWIHAARWLIFLDKTVSDRKYPIAHGPVGFDTDGQRLSAGK